MIHIRPMGRTDLPLGMRLGQQAGWNQTEADWLRQLELPASACFVAEVDAAAVLVNASSRFVDGGEFGFGAEIGISTQKLHARGPMALRELTTFKWVVEGDYQVRE